MTRSLRLSRRAVLRGGAGTLLALPLLEAMPSPARAAAAPRRFIGFFTTNGTTPERFWPTPVGVPLPAPDAAPKAHYYTGVDALETSDFNLPRILEPLARHRQELLVLEGIDRVGNGHGNYGSLLTGWAILGKGETGVGTSVDQELAKHIGKDTRLASLQLGVQVGDQGRTLGNVSWYGTGRPAPAENRPHVVFERLFGTGQADTAEAEAIRAEHRSVLDLAMWQIGRLEPRLGQADKQRLQQHLESLRSIERQVAALPELAACGAPSATDAALIKGKRPGELGPLVPAIAKLQIDLLAAAFACDQTRVATLQIGSEACGMQHPWVEVTPRVNVGFHTLNHSADSDVVAHRQITEVNRWYAEVLATLMDRLRSLPEAGGTVLDRSLLVWMTGLTKGNLHTARNQPILLAGRADGRFRTGRFVRLQRKRSMLRPNMFQPPDGRKNGDLLVTILHAFGVPAETFGDPAAFGGSLDAQLLA